MHKFKLEINTNNWYPVKFGERDYSYAYPLWTLRRVKGDDKTILMDLWKIVKKGKKTFVEKNG